MKAVSSKTRRIRIQRGSGNVFADLKLPNADERQHKAELAAEINALIRSRGLNQQQAAKRLGIDQPKVSDLSRGKLKAFSIERLLEFLTLLDRHVEIIVSPARKGRAAGLFVVAAG